MVQQMNDEQRLQTLEQYNPADHFITIRSKKTGTETQYYPASWRLYELRLHYPHITIESEILHLDQEHHFVIVKAGFLTVEPTLRAIIAPVARNKVS